MGKLESQFASSRVDALDLVLGDRAWLIFYLNLEILGGKNRCGKIQNIRQLLGREPVIRIIPCHPSLEKAGLQPPDGSATIDKILHHMPYLGNVEIGRNRVSVRKDEAHVLGWILTEVCLEGANVHAIMGIFSYRHMQAEIKYRPLSPLDYEQVVSLWQACDGVEVSALGLASLCRRFRAAAWVGNVIGFVLLINVGRVAAFSAPLPFGWRDVTPKLLLPYHLPYALILPVCVGGALAGHIVLTRALLRSRK